MASLSNSRWQNREERPKRSTNNEYMVHRPINVPLSVSDGLTDGVIESVTPWLEKS